MKAFAEGVLLPEEVSDSIKRNCPPGMVSAAAAAATTAGPGGCRVPFL